MRPMNVITLALVSLVAVGASAAKGEIQVTYWYLATEAVDSIGSGTPDFLADETESPTFPFAQYQTATSGGTWGESTYDFSADEHGASFEFLFDLGRSTSDSRASGFGEVRFTVSEPVEYNLEGSLSMLGTRRLVMEFELMDFLGYAGHTVYEGSHVSEATPDEAFSFGVAGGDVASVETGELLGTLAPGVPYGFHYNYWIENYPFDAGSSATADGMLSFTLDAAPEPGSLTLLVVGAIAVLRRRR
ncbi:MAG TPA: PEP-CTERM sorting domain-containing protein [Phycisphaerae bacterium]|nr:PEP-CTERM sorting domain-containing protein [Phycisphaerae bacterium]